jgi:hypothetical protein
MDRYCDLAFVCTNHECDHYRVSVDVKCRTELGSTSVCDERDLDCECGAQLVQVDLLGCEHVPAELIRRYQEVGA